MDGWVDGPMCTETVEEQGGATVSGRWTQQLPGTCVFTPLPADVLL